MWLKYVKVENVDKLLGFEIQRPLFQDKTRQMDELMASKAS